MTCWKTPRRSISRFALVTTLLLGSPLLLAQQELPGVPQAKTGAVLISADQIPSVRGPLAVLRLSSQKPPMEFLQQVLRATAPRSKGFAPFAENPLFQGKQPGIPEEMLGAFDGNRLVAYVNQKTGDTQVFPLLTQQKPLREEGKMSEQLERAASLARQLFSRQDILQKDSTRFEVSKPLLLYGEKSERGHEHDSQGERESFLAYVSALRLVGDYPVVGPGSRAMLVVGSDGTPQGFLRRWQAGEKFGQVTESRTQSQVAEAITAQLRPLSTAAEVAVLNVRVAYYDGNQKLLQPIYEFTARIHHFPQRKSPAGVETRLADDDFIVGYLPIGKEMESIPSLSRPAGPFFPLQPEGAGAGQSVKPGDPNVGRYVVRNDDPGWVADANDFWSNIASPAFVDSQYYWAFPFEFTSWEGSFVNSVNISLNEVHGNWWFFTTYQNWGDGVDITAIPASEGYGAANGGNLDYWILHSCEVVPSAIDAPCPSDSRSWWTPWFNMFQGLHSVVGYRTIMIIDDGVGGPYGNDLKLGAPVVSAWFNETAAAWIYQWDNFWGVTAQAHCGNLPLGRASTVSMCGREDDWAYDTSALPSASCLVNYWQSN